MANSPTPGSATSSSATHGTASGNDRGKTAKVLMYATSWCPYCSRARSLLESKRADLTIIDIERDPALRQEMMARSGRHTVPQIFIGDLHVGGCDDLHALDARGGLDPLLAG